jgi:hypothetical protein
MTFMGTQDGIGSRPQRETLGRAVGQEVELTVACLISYALMTQILIRVYSVSREDDLRGGMWAVIATVFVYRESHQKSVSAAISRMSATVLSFALCLIYLLFLPFHALGLATLIGAVVLILADRSENVITAAITTTVVMVVAGIAPQHAWIQLIAVAGHKYRDGSRDCGRVGNPETRISNRQAQPGDRLEILKPETGFRFRKQYLR